MTFIIFSKAAAPSGISTTFSADTPPAAVLALAAAALSNSPGAEPLRSYSHTPRPFALPASLRRANVGGRV